MDLPADSLYEDMDIILLRLAMLWSRPERAW